MEEKQAKHSISVILPVHNEEENIEAVVFSALYVLPKLSSDFEIIVVNDGSTDKTASIVHKLSTQHDSIKIINHPKNRGYGSSLISGFAKASKELIFFADSDKQFDLSELKKLVPFIDSFDIVAGYRIKRRDSHTRYIIGFIFNCIVRSLFGVRMKDINCGFKLFRGGILKNMNLSCPGALINTEIIAKANRQGKRIKEVGVSHYPRPAGRQSGASAKVVFRAIKEILKLRQELRQLRAK